MPFIVRLNKQFHGHGGGLRLKTHIAPLPKVIGPNSCRPTGQIHQGLLGSTGISRDISLPSRRPDLHHKHQYNFNLKPKRATVHSYVCAPIDTSMHIYKHTGHVHLPDVWVCNLHPCLCADVLHQHIMRKAALWLGLAVIDDRNPSLALWTAHNTSAGEYKISYITRGAVSTGTGVTEEPLAICTLNMHSNLQPCLVWPYWQFVNICYNTPYFQGASGSWFMLRVCSYAVSKRSLTL